MNLKPKYLSIQADLPVTCLDQTKIFKQDVCVIPKDDLEGIVPESCRSIIGLCYSFCSKPVLLTPEPKNLIVAPVLSAPKTAVEQIKLIVNNTSSELKQAVSQITDVAVSL